MQFGTIAFILLVSLGQTVPDYAKNKKNLFKYFDAELKHIEKSCLAHLSTKEAWEKDRPKMRQQFMEMMGLWPLPAKTDLKATITGSVEGEGFIVEKLHFQSMPGLYVTANLYRPRKIEGKLPTILYVCGHGNVVENGISYGSKVSYQYHPAWFATHGYICLILDTLQLGEIPGEHHGTYKHHWWYWQSLGFTPGGIELWNAIRALDYLETRPDVDATKIGVTGRSGGGATSWWILAADDRPVAFAPVAGIVDLRSHILEGATPRLQEGVVAGHCDCMFMVNTYRWDFAQVAALCAPRPLLLGNSDADDIFPVAGYRRLAEKVAAVYKLYGAEERFQLLETKGPHKDSPELRIGINRFMNKYLKGDTTSKVEDDLPQKLLPGQLKVFDKLPENAINNKLNGLMLAKVPQPAPDKDWRTKNEDRLLRNLREHVFAGWPKQKPIVNFNDKADKPGIEAYSFENDESQPALELRLHRKTLQAPKDIILIVETEYRDPGTFDDLLAQGTVVLELIPRGMGCNSFAAQGTAESIHLRRRFPLVGQTLEGMQVWDVRRALMIIEKLPKNPGTKIKIETHGDLGMLAVYAALFEPAVSELMLINPPTTHASGPAFLNVLKYLDFQQAVALLAPRRVSIQVKTQADRQAWDWCLRQQELAGEQSLKVFVAQ